MLLLIPATFRLGASTEPFPEIVLPSGGARIRVKEGKAYFSDLGVWGIDSQGRPKRIHASVLLDPVPDYYLTGLLAEGFGFNRDTHRDIRSKFRALRLSFTRHVPSERQRQRLADWLNAKLATLGLRPGQLIVRRDHLEVDTATGQELSRKTQHEHRIQF